MQFNSINFMVFFPVVLVVYFVIPKILRSFWLLIASYYFYMSWNPYYAFLIGFSTIVTFGCGMGIEKFRGHGKIGTRKCRQILLIGITINLFLLCIFKYGNFILETLDICMERLFHGAIDRRLNLLLPVGISFYTFQALGYVIDVYRGEIKAEKNIVRYALFVSFFPQLVAGPIERSKNLLGQIQRVENIRLWNGTRIASGAILMVWGLFLKMVISDRAAILVNTVFDHYRMYGSVELILAVIAFSLQIYCDFGSYSLMAIGVSKIMGFELMENFNAPYFAKNVRDFWGRWHISLSTWFKDYLYIPLGGNRKGKLRTAVNHMIVFLVSGLWHGANWSFILWGGIHGLYQITSDFFNSFGKKIQKKWKIKTNCFSWRFLQTSITFGLVGFAWIFFRADTVTDAFEYIKRIWRKPTPWILFNGGVYSMGLDRIEVHVLLFALCLLLIVDSIQYRKKQTIDEFLMNQNIWFEWLVIIVLIVMVFIYGEYGSNFDAQQFIYFQF